MDNQINHFSHHHPLTTLFADLKEVDDTAKDPEPYLCSICGLPILSSPSYTCTTSGCDFFLHKPCAQLPESLDHPRYHPFTGKGRHTLKLLPKPDSSPRIFTYHCNECELDHHPLVAGEVELEIKHKSHQAHSLVANCRETSSVCDACGEEQRGFFFTCHECNFWIHQDCTLQPSDITIASHSHPLILIYSLSHPIVEIECVVCERGILKQIGLYYCGDCLTVAHLSCAKKHIDHKFKSEISAKLIQLPSEDDEGSQVIRRLVERHIKRPIADDKNMMKIDERYHKHPNLILVDDGIRELSSGSSNLVCDACIRPINISSPFYACQQQLRRSNEDEYCHFFVHDVCAIILSRIHFSGEDAKTFPYGGVPCPDTSTYVFDSIFPCAYCHRPSNGLCCLVDDMHFMACLECENIPIAITHASHRQHVLVQTTRPGGMDENTIPLNCCSDKSLLADVFKCVHCSDFYIHLGCALLPKMTHHKFDEHPLELITHRRDCNSESRFCEFCEGDIDRQFWYYGCDECGNYFHIICIPSVGYLCKIKFGKTHFDHEIHDHPLTLTRMLTVARHERCGYCGQIIPGLADKMAFHCSLCDFWIHFDCARDSSCQPGLPVYSQVEDEANRKLLEILN